VRDAVSIPLFPMALVGLVLIPRPTPTAGANPAGGWGRVWLFVAIVAVASVLALVRLHATGGYCSPRHALILSLVLIPAAALGVQQTVAAVGDVLVQHLPGVVAAAIRPVLWTLVLGGLAFTLAPRTLAPLNEGLGAYRTAGRWLRAHAAPGSRVVDVSGWALFYGDLPGYTFRTLESAPGDPSVRWVVAREAHLRGPWLYCAQLRELIGAAPPAAVFHGANRRHATTVFVFDRQTAPPAAARVAGAESAKPR
jgi:hypothetical protein